MIPFSLTMRHVTALALASTLAACGGFTAVDVGGTITGLSGAGLVLTNGGSTVSPPPNATTFVFPTKVDIRAAYNIVVTTQPARQTCAVVNGSGIAGAAPVTIVNVICNANTYALGGRVSGLTGTGLVLTNGSDRIAITDGTQPFVFPTSVADGTVYGATVLVQPTGQTCAVMNGTAVMGAAAVTNLQVNCQ